MPQPQTIELQNYQQPDYHVNSVQLTFRLAPEGTEVTSRVIYQRNGDATCPLKLDGESLDLLSIALDDQPLSKDSYQLSDQGLTLLQPPAQFTLTITTRIHPASNSALEGLYQSGGNYCTQCEAQGFRRITYYQDRPDVMAPFDVRIEAEKATNPVLLSNGNMVGHGDLDKGWHWVEWQDPFAKPCYLFALVAGDLAHVEDHFQTMSGRDITLRIFTEAHHIHQCDHAMQSLKRAMRWDEERFGREYDLDLFMIVAVDDFNMGAMENKGLNIFNSRLVFASPETATDDDYIAIEAVIGHEYFHNWTGNRITCRDWFQLSLKEGLTVFRDQEFTADTHSHAVKRIEDVRMLRTHQFSEDASPMAHPIRPASYIEINNFYTVTVYEKGAEVVRLYHTMLGEDGFRRGMDLYFERHDGQAVTTEDFLAAMSDANDTDLSQMQRWYDQAGTPTLTVRMSYDAKNQRCTLHCQQSCPATPEAIEKKPFLIPLTLGLLLPDGQEAELQLEGDAEPQGTERTVLIRDNAVSFTFINIPARPIPSLLRNFSAPVLLNMEHNSADDAFLMAHDRDAFNRWDAAQRLTMKIMLEMLHEPTYTDSALIPAFQILLNDPQLDLALKAEALTLPSESDIAEASHPAHPAAIHQVRENLRRHIAEHLYGDFEAMFHQLQDHGMDDTAMQQRKLKHVCLSYLMASGRKEAVTLTYQHFTQATHMTDQYAALTLLAQCDCSERVAALQAFETQWQGDAHVMDKWFAAQASSPLSDTLASVQSLMNHPQFHFTNPNKVRALIGSFAMRNPAAFHRADGAGYTFLREQVLKLDAINPQIAARMVRPLISWRNIEPNGSALMQQELKAIAAQHGISNDLFEIVSKSLESDPQIELKE